MAVGDTLVPGGHSEHQRIYELRRERITEVPMILDAGVGTASDARQSQWNWAQMALMNTAMPVLRDSILMAEAMGGCVEAGESVSAGRIEKKLYATPQAPLAGVVR